MSGSKPIFYWDSCIYLAWLKNEQIYADYLNSIGDIIRQSRENKVVILTSTATILEVLDLGLDSDVEREFQSLFYHDIHHAIDVNIVVAFKARDYRRFYRSKGVPAPGFVDSIHMATAFIEGVDEMHTFDDGKKDKFSPLANSGNIAGDALTIVRPPKIAPKSYNPPDPIGQGTLFPG